jgi:hypothetical protein
MKNVRSGDRVWVPQSRVKLSRDRPGSLVQCEVVSTVDRTATIRIVNEADQNVAVSLLRYAQSILVVCIGDLCTERGLLDPLTKSALQFLRLLVPDDSVAVKRLRSVRELELIWASEGRLFSWLLLIGHGSPKALTFAVDGAVAADGVVAILEAKPPPIPVSILSLACRTGYRGFAGRLSESTSVSRVIAPYHSVHGAIASQFAQTFFANHLMQGCTARVAYRKSRDGTPDGTRFRMWEKGGMRS